MSPTNHLVSKRSYNINKVLVKTMSISLGKIILFEPTLLNKPLVAIRLFELTGVSFQGIYGHFLFSFS